MIGVDPVVGNDFGRGRHAQHSHAGGDHVAELMQHVGMADQNTGAGIFEDVIDFLRLEMPIDRHRVGAELHRGIGRLDERDVIAHEDADAVALPHPKPLETASNAGGAIGDLGVTTSSFTADDAKERRCFIVHFLFRCSRTSRQFKSAWSQTSAKRGARFSILARTASS